MIHLNVTYRQYNEDTRTVFSSTFHWIKNKDGIPVWSEVGDYNENYVSFGQEVIISYRGKHWDLELVKTINPNEVLIDVILTDLSTYDQHYFDEQKYDLYVKSADTDITHDYDNLTRVFWVKCNEILDEFIVIKTKDELLKNLDICHQIHEGENFPGFIFGSEQQEQPVKEEIIEKEITETLEYLTLDEDVVTIEDSSLGSVGITSEGITPTDDGTTNDPTINTSSNDGQTEDGVPKWITSSCEDKIESFVDDKINNEEKEPITIRGEDNA